MPLEQGYAVSAVRSTELTVQGEGGGVDVYLIVRPRPFESKSNPPPRPCLLRTSQLAAKLQAAMDANQDAQATQLLGELKVGLCVSQAACV